MSDPKKSTETRTREQTVFLNQCGRKWLQAFFSALRTSQIHDPENQIFDDPVNTLIKNTERILELEGHADFLIVNDQFFLNGLWIKPTLSERETLFSLVDLLKKLGLGGASIRSTTTSQHWRTFLRVYQEAAGFESERFSRMNEALGKQGIEHISVHRIMEVQEDVSVDLPLPPLTYGAVTAYAKALLALREFSRCAPGEEQVTALRKAQRIICELIDVSEKAPRLFTALTLLKNFDTYFYHHGVNVLVLSILLGKEIGISRKELVDLGMAALFHDIGKLQIPDEILSKPGALTSEEKRLIYQHPLESAKTFMTLGYMNLTIAERIMVAFQHHLVHRSQETYPAIRREMPFSLMAEIVGICVHYDSLTTPKTYRMGLTPWEVMRVLAAEGKAGSFRQDVLHAFFRLLGPLPFGSWVKFGEGKEGLVASSGTLSPHAPHVVVFYLNEQDQFQWIDSSTLPKAQGKPRLAAGRTTTHRYHQTIAAMFSSSENSPLLS